jgi:ATP-dependent RNA helicase DeaD
MLKKTFEQQPIPNGLEVCKKQLFHLIDRMQQVEINEEQIAPYINQIMSQLEYLGKAELLKRFVSLEFNRFLEYYKNAEDLNIPEKVKEERGGERSGGKQGKKSGEKVRLKLNIGDNEGANPRRILGIINDVTNDKSISIGSIEITNKFTFFDVYADQVKQLLNAFSRYTEYSVVEAKGKKQYDDHKPKKNWGGDNRGERRSESRGNGRKESWSNDRTDNRNDRRRSESGNSDKPWRKGRERNYERGRKK